MLRQCATIVSQRAIINSNTAARRASATIIAPALAAASVSTSASTIASSTQKVNKNNYGKYVFGAAAFAAASASVITVSAKEAPVDVENVKKDIADLIEKDNYIGPTFLRLAWHASGTFCKKSATGGSSGGTIRFAPEIKYGANAGLDTAVAALEPIKARYPGISYADLFVLAGVVAIEEMGGPEVSFRLGRKDATDGAACTEDGRLPDADKGSKPKTTQHVRDIFYRMGFNDREIVALVGAHAVGRCYPSRSGYSGPWTRAEWTFSNEYFRELIENKWSLKKWNGPEQYEDPSGDLMMLPADMALLWDAEFRKYVEMYAKDEELWHKDFAKAFKKLTENGVKFPSGWRKYIFFGPRE